MNSLTRVLACTLLPSMPLSAYPDDPGRPPGPPPGFGDPTEPTLDVYLPDADRATGAGVLDNGPHGFGVGTAIADATVQAWPTLALRLMARHQMIPPLSP
jgi:hypothetical protein